MLGLHFGKGGRASIGAVDPVVNFAREISYPELREVRRYLARELKAEIIMKASEYMDTSTYVDNSTVDDKTRTSGVYGVMASVTHHDDVPYEILEKESEQRIYFTGLEFKLLEGQFDFAKPQKELIKSVRSGIDSYFAQSKK